MPGQGGRTDRQLAPSALVRVGTLFRLVETLGAEWWLGLALEERAVAIDSTRLSRAVGLVLEGRAD